LSNIKTNSRLLTDLSSFPQRTATSQNFSLFPDDNKAPPTAFFALRPQTECLQQARRSLKQAKALHDGALFRLSLARCLASRQQQPQPQQQQQQISSAREAQTGFVRDRERRSLALRQATSKEAPVIRAWQ
jgi:hypothetical protein